MSLWLLASQRLQGCRGQEGTFPGTRRPQWIYHPEDGLTSTLPLSLCLDWILCLQTRVSEVAQREPERANVQRFSVPFWQMSAIPRCLDLLRWRAPATWSWGSESRRNKELIFAPHCTVDSLQLPIITMQSYSAFQLNPSRHQATSASWKFWCLPKVLDGFFATQDLGTNPVKVRLLSVSSSPWPFC